jgi:hypothetical protein
MSMIANCILNMELYITLKNVYYILSFYLLLTVLICLSNSVE